MKHFWISARIDAVKHEAAGQGSVTVTLLGGGDPSLYADFEDNGGVPGRPGTGVVMACADPTLRTWWQNHDKASGSVTARRTLPDPPPGSSGIELDIRLGTPLQEGFQPGRFVRLGARSRGWPESKPPPEWRLTFP
jgi:hypothetical protein